MIRAAILCMVAALGAGPAPAAAQEAVASYTAPGAAPVTDLMVRSTTDIAIFSPVLQAFVAQYPQIRLSYEQWGSNALYARTLADCEAGNGPAADAVISSGVHQMVDLVNRACASPYRSPQTLSLPDNRSWRDEVWGITQEAAVIIYNTDLVPVIEAPRTRFDVLDLMRRKPATYRDRIATYDIEASGLGYLFAFMDSQEATTFGGLLEGFARVDAVATCCSAEIIQGVAQGRYLIAYNVLGSYLESVPLNNVGIIYPEDYTLFLSRAFLIPKGAQRPETAAVLLDFLLSPQGQAALAQSNLVQSRHQDEGPLQQSGQRYIPIDPTLLVALDQHRRAGFVAQWRSTFGPDVP